MSKKAIEILFEKLKDKIKETQRIAELNNIRHRSEWEVLSKSCIHRENATGAYTMTPFNHEDAPISHVCKKEVNNTTYYTLCTFENCPLLKKV